MFLINPQITTNILNNDGYNQILDSIDRTIAVMAGTMYKNDSYGFRGTINFELYWRLCEYREILLDKFLGCNCLEDEYTIYIISRIQKLVC